MGLKPASSPPAQPSAPVAASPVPPVPVDCEEPESDDELEEPEPWESAEPDRAEPEREPGVPELELEEWVSASGMSLGVPPAPQASVGRIKRCAAEVGKGQWRHASFFDRIIGSEVSGSLLA